MPARIYPGSQIAANTDLSGSTPISILFDLDLSWQFETSSPDAPNQMFAYMPAVIANALGIDQSQVMTLYLQVYQPVSYQNASDVAQLATEYLAYIPSDSVEALAAQIKVKTSAFYTGSAGIGGALAGHVDSAFAINSVTPGAGSGSSGSSGGSSSTTASSAASKTRQDAIIGVVSALGAIALAILALLLYRGYKRRQELAHHRLSDPVGARPTGREFDQDSLGGQRRRSFYYAEDSLSGGQAQASDDHYDYRANPNTSETRERRPVLTGQISTPYLQQSSMNW